MSDNIDIARLQRIVLLARDLCRLATDLMDNITTYDSEDSQQLRRAVDGRLGALYILVQIYLNNGHDLGGASDALQVLFPLPSQD